MSEFWLSIFFGILLVIIIRREAQYREISEKTIILLRYCVDENTRRQKALVDLISNRFPHLMPQVDEILKRQHQSNNKIE